MAPFSDSVRDQYNRPVLGATVHVFTQAGALAALYTASGGLLANPLPVDALGNYEFYADDAKYRREIRLGSLLLEASDIIVGNPPEFKGAPGPAGNVAGLLEDLQFAPITNGTMIAAYDGSGSTMTWTTGDFAALAAQRPQDYVQANGTPLSTGAWVRQGADAIRLNRPVGTTSLQVVTEERINTRAFGSDATAFQAALDTAASRGIRRVLIDNVIGLEAGIVIPGDVSIEAAGSGKLVVPTSAADTFAFPNPVLRNAAGARNIRLVNLRLDCSGLPFGARGISMADVIGLKVEGGRIDKAYFDLESTDNTIDRDIGISDLTMVLDGYTATAIRLSGVRGVDIRGGSLSGGREGIGIYTAARAISQTGVKSFGHTGDGFVIIDGQEITYSQCIAYSNGQSGFTTQRQTAAANARIATWSQCHAPNNLADGFDIRGANVTPFGVDTLFALIGCSANGNGDSNGGAGFYIVNAEGTTLEACTAARNSRQGLFVNTSDRVIVTGFRSISNASAIASGNNKAGILIYNSNGVQIKAPVSGNADSVQQDVGISFTGSSMGGAVVGGDLTNNALAPFFTVGNSVTEASADTLAGAGVFFRSISRQGLYYEEGTVVPTHIRPRGSIFMRYNGGNPEYYISNGGGVWSRLALAA